MFRKNQFHQFPIPPTPDARKLFIVFKSPLSNSFWGQDHRRPWPPNWLLPPTKRGPLPGGLFELQQRGWSSLSGSLPELVDSLSPWCWSTGRPGSWTKATKVLRNLLSNELTQPRFDLQWILECWELTFKGSVGNTMWKSASWPSSRSKQNYKGWQWNKPQKIQRPTLTLRKRSRSSETIQNDTKCTYASRYSFAELFWVKTKWNTQWNNHSWCTDIPFGSMASGDMEMKSRSKINFSPFPSIKNIHTYTTMPPAPWG